MTAYDHECDPRREMIMDSFVFTLSKDAIEVIGEALDIAPLARRRTNPVVVMMQEQILTQQGAPAPRKPRRKRDPQAGETTSPPEMHKAGIG